MTVVVLPLASVVLIVVRDVPLLFTRVSTVVDALPDVRELPLPVVVPEVRDVVDEPEVRLLPVLVFVVPEVRVVVVVPEVRLLPVLVFVVDGRVVVLSVWVFALAAARSCPALR